MKNRYEALLILNTKGNEEGAKELIERLEADFQHEGAVVEQVQKMGRHQFSYAAGALDGGFYVNFIFAAEPATLEKLRARLKLDEQIYTQHYQRLGAPRKARAAKEAPAAG